MLQKKEDNKILTLLQKKKQIKGNIEKVKIVEGAEVKMQFKLLARNEKP